MTLHLPRPGQAMLLAACCLVQIAIAVVVAATSTHNHLVFYSGGDATEYWTSSWSIAHGSLPQAYLGYFVPVLYAWVPLFTGATLIEGLPVIAIVQGGLLVVAATLLVHAIGNLLFGRRYAWVALAIWIAGPLFMLWGFRGDYAPQFRDLFLAPHWFGLTNMADMPSLVAVLATTWAALRVYARPALGDALLTGLLVGVAIGMKPSNGFFVPALAVLVVATRNARVVAAVAAGAAPALVTLALWKQKGRGYLPITSLGRTREAVGAHPVVAGVGTYVHFDSAHLGTILHDLSEVFWSVRLLEFLFFAGLIGALRRSIVKGAFLGLWCAGFVILKGSSTLTSISALNFWRYVEVGLPAFVFLAASTMFLLPAGGREAPAPATPRSLPGPRLTLATAVVFAALVPLVVVAAEPAATSAAYVRDNKLANDAPVSGRLAVTAAADSGTVRLAWRPIASSTHVYYVVYRSDTDVTCTYPGEGAKECELAMSPVGYTRNASFTDRPGSGRHWYRIGLEANYRDAMDGSDLMLIGPATPAG